MKKETKNEEVINIFIICEKGDKNMKVSLSEYIKLGFGFYIGYNIARALKYSLLIKK